MNSIPKGLNRDRDTGFSRGIDALVEMSLIARRYWERASRLALSARFTKAIRPRLSACSVSEISLLERGLMLS